MKVFASAEDRKRTLVYALLLLAGFAILYVAVRRYAPFVFHPTELRTWIEQFGPFAPLVFIVAQAVQVIVAPVPGQVAALVGGYLFGPVEGTIYSMTGVMIGSAIAFSLSKRFGRPAVERLVHEDLIERFDGFVDQVGLPGLFIFVVIPGLPDDAICFLAGLTRFRLLTFLVVLALGRTPAYVLTNYAGGSFAAGRTVQGIVLLAIVVAASVLAYLNRDAIRRFVRDV